MLLIDADDVFCLQPQWKICSYLWDLTPNPSARCASERVCAFLCKSASQLQLEKNNNQMIKQKRNVAFFCSAEKQPMR